MARRLATMAPSAPPQCSRSPPDNLWANPSLTSAPDDLHLPAGLNIDEAVRFAEAITASHAESTHTVNDWAFSR